MSTTIKRTPGSTWVVLLGLLAGVTLEAREVFDDFVDDPDHADCDPVCWQFAICCPGTIGPGACRGIEGIELKEALPETWTGLATTESFAGDVLVHLLGSICRSPATLAALLHFDAFSITGYPGGLTFAEDNWWIGIQKWNDGRVVDVWSSPAPIDPSSGPVHVAFTSVGGQLELRVWADGAERPVEAQLIAPDPEFRIGSSGLAGSAPGTVVSRIRITELGSTLFRRGDDNDDGVFDISDPKYSLEHQFLGLHEPRCLAALDTNGDGELDISDPIYNLEHQFLGRPAPPAPHPDCGPESLPSARALSCEVQPESCP